MDPVVVVGAGLAGYSVARETRKLDREIPLVVVAADSAHFYPKPQLSNAIATKRLPEHIAQSDAHQMSEQLGATVRANVRVTGIDTQGAHVNLGGESLRYSHLVLALGADQINVPLAGDASDTVVTVNDLTDYGKFRALIEGKRHVTIIGGGLIGCEFANDLVAGGLSVAVVDTAPQPLSRLIPTEGGEFLRRALSELGVRWFLGTSVASVDHAPDGLRRVQLANGENFATDTVLSAVGLRPRMSLASAAGIRTNRGVVVDRHLRTSADNVYALGDCAEIDGLVMPYVLPIMHSARALAVSLTGTLTQATFPPMPIQIKTPACPIVVASPIPGLAGRWHTEGTDGGLRCLYLGADGALLGFALLGKATQERLALTRQLQSIL